MKTGKIFIAIGLMIMTGLAYAQPGNGNGQRGEGRQNREFRQGQHHGLDLTEEQQSQAKTIKLNMQKSALPVQNQLGENRAKMRTLTTAESPDMKAINKLIDEDAKLEAKLNKLRAANHQEFRKILTDEQRIKFDSQSMQRAHNRRGVQKKQMGQKGAQREYRNKGL